MSEAMSEAREFDSEQEMKEWLVKDWDCSFTTNDVVIDTKAIKDEWTGWMDTRHVCIKRMGIKDFVFIYGCPQCIGWCATEYTK